jgi:NAD(P) transhydrogenase subunit alpha
MKQVCVESDVIITTAQVFGRPAPVIVTSEMVEAMHPGSVIIDLAIESGGNVQGAVFGKIVEKNGVRILGFPNLPGRVPVHASQVYSTNLVNFLEEFWDRDQRRVVLGMEDEIIRNSLLTHGGEICHPKFKELWSRRANLCEQREPMAA